MDLLARSIIGWWEDAGVDTFVDEVPRDWLAAPRAPSPAAAPIADGPVVAPPAPPAAPAPPAELPATLAEFRAWLLADPAIPGRAAARVDAQGEASGGTMILVDMPESEDRAARRLLSGEAGILLDRMLGAMGLTRDTIYLAAFSPARPASGSLEAATVSRLQPIARHHLTLAAPARLLIMGEAPAQALLGLGSHAARGRVHMIEIAGRSLPAVVTFPPRFILQAGPHDLKERRTLVWADLQLFMAQ